MLTQLTTKTKCDVRDCVNLAEYQFAVKGRVGRCFICSKCLEQLSKELSALRVPRSPKNTIRKKMELKEQENNNE